MSFGVIFTAVGKKYVHEAELASCTIKKWNSRIPVTLFTDNKSSVNDPLLFDQVITIDPSGKGNEQKFLDRLSAYKNSPYQKTLALDTDTMILDDIEELFKVLDKFDIALCHGHNRVKRFYEVRNLQMANPEIPYAFAPIQGGLILFNNNEKIHKFFDQLINKYKEKQYWDDQPSVLDILWNGEVNFYILPREYNFNSIEDFERWETFNFSEARPKIFHYSRHKNDVNLFQKIEKYLQKAEFNEKAFAKGYKPKEQTLSKYKRKFKEMLRKVT